MSTDSQLSNIGFKIYVAALIAFVAIEIAVIYRSEVARYHAVYGKDPASVEYVAEGGSGTMAVRDASNAESEIRSKCLQFGIELGEIKSLKIRR